MTIQEFVRKYAERGECKCGKCIDRGDKPDPGGHTADVIFFKVAMREGATAEKMIELSKKDAFEFYPFDGNEHNYLELGAWIGSQDLALQFMGLCHLLKTAQLMTPRTVLGKMGLSDDDVMAMAGNGLLSIIGKH